MFIFAVCGNLQLSLWVYDWVLLIYLSDMFIVATRSGCYYYYLYYHNNNNNTNNNTNSYYYDYYYYYVFLIIMWSGVLFLSYYSYFANFSIINEGTQITQKSNHTSYVELSSHYHLCCCNDKQSFHHPPFFLCLFLTWKHPLPCPEELPVLEIFA